MSTSLKQLEEILGVMLVQRGSRVQGFTPEGARTLDGARRHVRRSQAGHLEGSRPGSTVPLDARHAEPAHHRSRAGVGWGRGDAYADVELAGGPLYPCENGALGERDAGKARGDSGAG